MPGESESNIPEWTVGDLSATLRRTLEGAFGRVRVRGEVSAKKRAASGHVYFDLKDARAVLAAVLWRGVAARLSIAPEDGMEVVATGKISSFAQQSRYQLIVDSIEPAGPGALAAMLETRRRQLAAEGLFDDARKRPLPYLPRVIGVITSPTGAVIRDIMHRLRARFPTHLLLWPVAVQGKNCAADVAAALHGFPCLARSGATAAPDLLIVARGGGSLEDLWGFNEEIVVRAIAQCAIPVITAIGHETDWTLADYAADCRAPTPTAAAEMAVPVRSELRERLSSLDVRRQRSVVRFLARARERLGALKRLMPRGASLPDAFRQRLDAVSGALSRALAAQRQRKQAALKEVAGRLRTHLVRGAVRRMRERFSSLDVRRQRSVVRFLARARERLGALKRLMPRGASLPDAFRQRLDAVSGALSRALAAQRQRKQAALKEVAGRLRTHLVRGAVRRMRERLSSLDVRRQRSVVRFLARARERLGALKRLMPRGASLPDAFRQRLDAVSGALSRALAAQRQRKQAALKEVAGRLRTHLVRGAVRRMRERLSHLRARMDALGTGLSRKRRTLAEHARLLGVLSHRAALERGFALIRDTSSGRLLTRAAKARKTPAMEILFTDGAVNVTQRGSAAPAARRRTLPDPRKGDPRQRDLFDDFPEE